MQYYTKCKMTIRPYNLERTANFENIQNTNFKTNQVFQLSFYFSKIGKPYVIKPLNNDEW